MQLESLARIEIKTQRWAEAAGHIDAATRISAEVGESLKLADCLATAAVWAARQKPENAAVLWGAGRAVADSILPYRVPLAEIVDRTDLVSAEDSDFYTQSMLDLRDRLGTDLARQADDRGAAMGLDAILGLVRQVLAETPAPRAGSGETASNLTRRERDLIALVAEGLTDAEIAQKLFISIRTVRSHLDRIKDKTGARRRAELTRLALRQGLA
jgi:DNA-binding CsgD family transcriptional regulator